MYADKITASMQQTIDETERRRSLQLKYNEEHGITPQAIIKARNSIIGVDKNMTVSEKTVKHARKYESNVVDVSQIEIKPREYDVNDEFNRTAGFAADPIVAYMQGDNIEKSIEHLKRLMIEAAKRMDFLEAAQYRDEILKLQQRLQEESDNDE